MSTLAAWEFLEIADEVRPVDRVGTFTDLAAPTGLTIPAVAVAKFGRGRVLGPSLALEATEVVADSAFLARDATLICWLDFKIENYANAQTGLIYIRHGGSNLISFAVELERVTSTQMRIRAVWNAPGLASTVGVTFTKPVGEFQIAVVRQWNSVTDVDVRYFVNGDLIGSENVTDGLISPTTGGVMAFGGNPIGGYSDFMPADTLIDSAQIEDDPVTNEEIRQIYRRFAVHQPSGYKILRAFLPQGTAWSRDPDSNIQKWIAAEGDALGLEIADIERFREDYLPDRAYGGALEDWERITGQVPKPSDTVEQRRARVLGFLRTVLGFPVDEIKTALEPLFGLASADIQIIEFDGLREDDFSTEDIIAAPSRMWITRVGDGAVVVDTGTPECDFSYGVGDDCRWWQEFPVYPTQGGPVRETSINAAPGDVVDGAMIIGDLVTTTAATDRFAGLFMRPAQGVDVILWGLRGNPTDLVHWTADNQGLNVPTVIAAAVAVPVRLAMRFVGVDQYELGRIIAGAFVVDTTVTGPLDPKWAGFGAVEITNQATAYAGSFQNLQVFEPRSPRAFNYIAVRNPALPGAYDLDSAQAQLDQQSPSHTRGVAAENDQGIELGPTGLGKLGISPLYPKI